MNFRLSNWTDIATSTIAQLQLFRSLDRSSFRYWLRQQLEWFLLAFNIALVGRRAIATRSILIPQRYHIMKVGVVNAALTVLCPG